MAWICQNCNTQINEFGFEVCWNCGCEKGQTKPPESKLQALTCLRCDSTMLELGSKEFHEGTRWGVIGNLEELFVDKQALDMFACKLCGKVEFFFPPKKTNSIICKFQLDGIGASRSKHEIRYYILICLCRIEINFLYFQLRLQLYL